MNHGQTLFVSQESLGIVLNYTKLGFCELYLVNTRMTCTPQCKIGLSIKILKLAETFFYER